MPLAKWLDFRVFVNLRPPASLLHNAGAPLMGFSSTSEYVREASGRHNTPGPKAKLDGSSLEVSAPTAYPRSTTAALVCRVCLTRYA
jgi:hypothetical protein